MDVWFCCISIHRVLIIYRINITADCFATHATCDVIDVLLRYKNTKVKDLIKLCHLCFFRFCKLLLLQSLSVFYWSLLVHSKTFISSEIKLFLIIPLQNRQHVFVSWSGWHTECKSNVKSWIFESPWMHRKGGNMPLDIIYKIDANIYMSDASHWLFQVCLV